MSNALHENEAKGVNMNRTTTIYNLPPKIDFKTLSGKRDNAVHALKESFKEFEALYSLKPDLNLLPAIFNEIESKYRLLLTDLS